MTALASPELTGLSRQDLAALAARPELPWAAAREQRLHLDRGRSRRARTGPAAPFRYPLQTLLLAAICHHRPGMPWTRIAALLGARHSTIAPAGQAITALLGTGHPALAPGPARIRTPAGLRQYAATAGIAIPDPPPGGRLRRYHGTGPRHAGNTIYFGMFTEYTRSTAKPGSTAHVRGLSDPPGWRR